jgi:hypothetical protein
MHWLPAYVSVRLCARGAAGGVLLVVASTKVARLALDWWGRFPSKVALAEMMGCFIGCLEG